MIRTVAIAGAGHTGRTLGRLLAQAGWRIGGVACRTEGRAREAAAFIGGGEPTDNLLCVSGDADLVLLTVPDAAILVAADRLRPRKGAVVAHACGALPAAVLSTVRPLGAFAGGLHPLRSFADPALAAERFPGTWCAIDGDADALPVLEQAVRAMAGTPLRVDSAAKPLYHAGAVFASNYLVAVLEAALRLFAAAGVERRAALDPILTLVRGTVENVGQVGIPAALTGPVERGDVGTIRAHVHAIRETLPGLAEAYANLARLACEVAMAKGTIDPAVAGRINTELGGGSAGIRVGG